MNFSAYLFKDGYDDVVRNARLIADAAAPEIARDAAQSRPTTVERRAAEHRRRSMYPGLVAAVRAGAGDAIAAVRAGPLGPCGAADATCRRGSTDSDGVRRHDRACRSPDAPGEDELIVRARSVESARRRRRAS